MEKGRTMVIDKYKIPYEKWNMALMHVGIANPHWRENVPGIPGAWATRNFTNLARAPQAIARAIPVIFTKIIYREIRK